VYTINYDKTNFVYKVKNSSTHSINSFIFSINIDSKHVERVSECSCATLQKRERHYEDIFLNSKPSRRAVLSDIDFSFV